MFEWFKTKPQSQKFLCVILLHCTLPSFALLLLFPVTNTSVLQLWVIHVSQWFHCFIRSASPLCDVLPFLLCCLFLTATPKSVGVSIWSWIGGYLLAFSGIHHHPSSPLTLSLLQQDVGLVLFVWKRCCSAFKILSDILLLCLRIFSWLHRFPLQGFLVLLCL